MNAVHIFILNELIENSKKTPARTGVLLSILW